MKLFEKSLIALFLTLSFSSVSAYDIEDNRYPRDPTYPSNFNFYLGGEVSVKKGSIKSADNSFVQDSSLLGWSGNASVGFTFFMLKVGAGYDYTSYGQSTDAAEVGNVNSAGKMKGAFIVGGLKFIGFEISYKHFLNSTYEFSQVNSLGVTSSLEEPSVGSTVQFVYFPHEHFYWGVNMTKFTFDQYVTTSTRILTESEKVSIKDFGLVIGFMY
jgi:hypothetical protein